MVCSIIGDMDITAQILRRLEAEIVRIIETHAQSFFLVGDMTEFEKVAGDIVKRICRTEYFAGYNIVRCEQTDEINTLTPDGIWMVKEEYISTWRNMWMMEKSSGAIICLRDRDTLPVVKDIRTINIIDISGK